MGYEELQDFYAPPDQKTEAALQSKPIGVCRLPEYQPFDGAKVGAGKKETKRPVIETA